MKERGIKISQIFLWVKIFTAKYVCSHPSCGKHQLASSSKQWNSSNRSQKKWMHSASPDSPKLVLLHICLDFSRKSLTPQLSTVYPIQCNSFLSHLKLGALIFGHRLSKVRLNSSIQCYLMALSRIFSDSKYSLHPLPHEKITFTCYSIFYPWRAAFYLKYR